MKKAKPEKTEKEAARKAKLEKKLTDRKADRKEEEKKSKRGGSVKGRTYSHDLTPEQLTLAIYHFLTLAGGRKISLTDLCERFKVSKSTINRRLEAAEHSGLTGINSEFQGKIKVFWLENPVKFSSLDPQAVRDLKAVIKSREKDLPDDVALRCNQIVAMLSTHAKTGKSALDSKDSCARHEDILEEAIEKNLYCNMNHKDMEKKEYLYAFAPETLLVDKKDKWVEGYILEAKSLKPEKSICLKLSGFTRLEKGVKSVVLQEKNIHATKAAKSPSCEFSLCLGSRFNHKDLDQPGIAIIEIIHGDDGSRILRGSCQDEEHLLRWLLSQGKGIKLLEPRSLVEKYKNEIYGMLVSCQD